MSAPETGRSCLVLDLLLLLLVYLAFGYHAPGQDVLHPPVEAARRWSETGCDHGECGVHRRVRVGPFFRASAKQLALRCGDREGGGDGEPDLAGSAPCVALRSAGAVAPQSVPENRARVSAEGSLSGEAGPAEYRFSCRISIS